jgi:transposase-like protein
MNPSTSSGGDPARRGSGNNRNILIAVVDGLKGLPEVITTVFPQTLVQTASCI